MPRQAMSGLEHFRWKTDKCSSIEAEMNVDICSPAPPALPIEGRGSVGAQDGGLVWVLDSYVMRCRWLSL